MKQTDSELLQRYAAERAEPAFAELVRRHIDLVFSAALRQTEGERQLAEDVTQNVFSDLARKAARLKSHTSLAGWLYTSTRYAARSARRSDRRRQILEQHTFAMNQLLQPEPSLDWEKLRPLLDDAMHALNESDRQAVMLRFFNRLSLAEVGDRLAVSENTARMRVERALDKLRGHLEKQGFTSRAAILATLLSNYAVEAAPMGLAAIVTKTAVAASATAAAGGLAALIRLKGPLAAAAVVAILAATLMVRHYLGADRPATPAAQAAPPDNSPTPVAEATAGTGAVPSETPVASVLTLVILNGKSGEALTGVKIDEQYWLPSKVDPNDLKTYGSIVSGSFGIQDTNGVARLSYPANPLALSLWVKKEGYADTTLTWHPEHGETIPQTYTVRPALAIPMAGKVVDEQGQPIAGATVKWAAAPDFDAEDRLSPEGHTVYGTSATTDPNGRWQVKSMAEDVIHRLSAEVSHPQYGKSVLRLESNPAMEQQLRDGSLVFTLKSTVAITGTVMDSGGKPVAGVKIRVGRTVRQQPSTWPNDPEHRQTTTLADGSFTVDGCMPGEAPVTAEADGFAPTGIMISVATDSPPVRLTMQPAQTLRLRVNGPGDTPIAGADVAYSRDGTPIPGGEVLYERGDPFRFSAKLYNFTNYPDLSVAQVNFSDQKTGPDGRLTWTNAPSGELMFTVAAPGFTKILAAPARADGQEHVITLKPVTHVTGAVRDETSGAAIPRFRVFPGYPERQPLLGRTNIHWINNRVEYFSDGAYKQDFNSPLVIGPNNPGHVLKFDADGYEPFVSRIIEEGEGEVQLDVSLRPSQETIITVLKPDGQPAVGADVGLVSPGAELKLGFGAFIRQDNLLNPALRVTELDGRFRLTSDPSVTRIIIACAEGYLSATPESLKSASTVSLEPWGSIEGICVADGQPVAGQRYKLALEGEDFETVACASEAYEVESDAQGRFAIQRAPPGNNNLQRVATRVGPNGPLSSGGAEGQTHLAVRPGETTTITLQP